MLECKHLAAWAVTLASIATAHAAHAADAPLWELGLGAAALQLPQYRGADRQSSLLLPLPYVVYRGPVLQADREGARATLFEQGAWRLNLSAALSPPVDSEDNPARAGMPKLAAAGEIGPDLVWRLTGKGRRGLAVHWPLRAVVTLQRDPQAIGWVSTPHLQWNGAVGAWQVGLRGGPVWGSRRHHDYYYGVADAYATAQRPAYKAAGGYGGLQALMSVSRRFDNLWLGAYAQADSLRGTAMARSPLLRRERGFALGLGMAWIFATSSQRVSTAD